MTLREFAAESRYSVKTVRRWIRRGQLPARIVPLETTFEAFRYDIDPANLPQADLIHQEQMEKLRAIGPGLHDHLRRRLRERRQRPGSPRMRHGRKRPEPIRCPHCRYPVWIEGA